MRKDMRQHYIKADAGMNGVNFGVAETGTIVVATNEGNADISANIPPLFVASMGIEKLIPRERPASVHPSALSQRPRI